MDTRFSRVIAEKTGGNATLVAWDTCHKIYVALDATEARWYENNYNETFTGTQDEMTEKLWEWYTDSCSLKMIDATSWDTEHQNSKFISVIPQGASGQWGWTTEEDHWERKENA